MRVPVWLTTFFIFGLFSASCDSEQKNPFSQDVADPAAELLQADRNFSSMSAERGMRKAFLQYMAKDGVLLRADEFPLKGADAIEYLSQLDDTSFTMTWAPTSAKLSADGTLGYTYGLYNAQGKDTILQGTYVSIWKKQNGEWKYVLETFNQGLSNQ